MMVDILSATLNRAKTHSILPAGRARKTAHALGERGGGAVWGWGHEGPSTESELQHGGMYTTVARSSLDKALPLKKMK